MNRILEGDLKKNMFLFAMPIALSSICQQLFNSADTAVVGRFADTSALAAVGTNAEIVALLVSISAGLAVGLNVLIAWKAGAGEKDGISDAIHSGIALSLITGILMTVICELSAAQILKMIQVPSDVFPKALNYLRIYSAGLPFLLLYDFGSAVERARGTSRRPLYALMTSGILNVILNLIFVIAFDLGVAGVAYATDISTAFSAFLTLHWLSEDKDEDFRFSWKKIKLKSDVTSEILRIGVPAALQGAVFCFANIFVQAAVNTFGATATAGAAAAMNFEYFTYYMITAFGQTVTTFTSQNQAAGNDRRCRDILFTGMILSFILSAAISTPLTIWCEKASGLYSTDPAVIAASCQRIKIILVLTPICSFYEIPAGFLRGYGKSLLPALETVTGTCLLRIVWIMTGFVHFHSLTMLYIIFPISWIVTITMPSVSTAGYIKKLPALRRAESLEGAAE
jgi:putative MATE family efflux protein